MQAGFVLPGGTADEQIRQAVAAEAAGWDAVFVWEGAYHLDAWCLLAAIAGRTTAIKVGTMLTPLPWRAPWEVAAQAATVDQLSGGRVILSVGLGAAETGRVAAGQPEDAATRAGILDEALEIIERLWRGETAFEGNHYTLEMAPEPRRMLRPVQQPRIPIWVVGAWKRGRSMRRAARFDGVIPHIIDQGDGGFDGAYREMVGWVRDHPHEDARTAEVIWEGETPADDPAAASARVTRWRDRGATWWLESRWGPDRTDVWARIEAGPPRPSPV